MKAIMLTLFNYLQSIIMLSYRHAFHTGNHADVLKHYVLGLVLAHTIQKPAPFWYVDTHAGAGLYSLTEGYAAQNAEFEQGIEKLMFAERLPTALAEFVRQIKSFNANALAFYPGSPLVAQLYLRADDKMRLFELHPNDNKLLLENFKRQGRQVKIELQDGFAGLKAMLPPPTRRAVVLIDPPYEEKQDYQRVVEMIKDSLKRFATGTYIVWYPLLQRPEPHQMVEALKQLDLKSWLNVSLTVQEPSIEGFGMYGSGLFIVNPPWTLPATLQEVMPYLAEKLALDDTASFEIDSHIS